MKKQYFAFIALLALAMNGEATVVTFTGVGYTNVASVSPGSVTVSGPVTSAIYTVTGLDVDGDGTNDTFSIQIDVSSSNGTVSWDAAGGEYDHNGNTISVGDDMTFAFGGVFGTLSEGGSAMVSNFTFDVIKMKRWQSANDAYTITQSGSTSPVQTVNTFALSDDNFTITGVVSGNSSFNPEYFSFTIDVANTSPPLPPTTANGKNLIWIITDEHNLRTLGCYRDTMTQEQAEMWGAGNVVETPHVDSFADNGALFTRMHPSTPTCTPSRGSMFSGIYPQNLGIHNNSTTVGDGKYLRADVTTIFDVLKDAGYLTGYAGKWHLGEHHPVEDVSQGKWWEPYPLDDTNDTYGIVHNEFMFNGGHDKWYGIVEGGLPATANGTSTPTTDGDPYLANKNSISEPPHHYRTEDGQLFVDGVHDETLDGKLPFYSDGNTTNVRFQTDWLTDRAKEFVTDFKSDGSYTSFFYVISIPDPHTADSVRAPYSSMYTNLTFELPRTWLNPNYDPADPFSVYGDNPSWMVADGKAADLHDPLDTGSYTIQDKVAQYFGMVKCIDDNVGRLVRHLDNEGLLEDTLLLFSSDHGDLFGEHRRVNKGAAFDMSMRIPFVLVDGSQLVTPVLNNNPLVPRGMIVEQAGNTTDWLETFLGLLDVNNIPDTPGRDLTPLLDPANTASWDDTSMTRKGWVAATDSRYKLVVDFFDKATWLFDLERDPDEFINFVDDPDYEGVVRKLGQAARTYMIENNDPDTGASAELERLLSGWPRYAEVYGLNSDQSGDQDSDGLFDIHEYTFGTDPLDPANTSRAPAIQINPSNGWATLTHSMRSPADTNIPYAVEWRTNLVFGAAWSGMFDSVTNHPAAPGFDQVERTVEQNLDELYFRFTVTQP